MRVFAASYAKIHQAIHALVKPAIKSRDMAKDLDPMDFPRARIGVANVATNPDWQQSASRLIEILITGSRPIESKGGARRRPPRGSPGTFSRTQPPIAVPRQSSVSDRLHRAITRKRHQMQHWREAACFVAKQVLSQRTFLAGFGRRVVGF